MKNWPEMLQDVINVLFVLWMWVLTIGVFRVMKTLEEML
jgi:hypothetical protein